MFRLETDPQNKHRKTLAAKMQQGFEFILSPQDFACGKIVYR